MSTAVADPLSEALVDEENRTVPEVPQEAPDAAPWGYKPDGTPYKRDPSRYAKRAENRATAPSKRSVSNKPTAAKGPNYEQSVLGILQIPAAALALGGQVTKSPSLVADAAAVSMHGPVVASALDQVARENAQVAAILDKISVVGPYSALLGAVIPFALQIVVNHSGKQVSEQVTAATGVMSRDALIAHVAGQAA